MGIWEKPGHQNSAMLKRLEQIAGGYDALGRPVTPDAQIAAATQAAAIRAEQLRAAAASETAKAAQQASEARTIEANAASERQRADADIEEKKLALEQQRINNDARLAEGRLQIEQAAVMVKALEVAVKGGIEPAQLAAAISELGMQLTGQGLNALTDQGLKALTANGDIEENKEES